MCMTKMNARNAEVPKNGEYCQLWPPYRPDPRPLAQTPRQRQRAWQLNIFSVTPRASNKYL
mgnify:CR=1 FL=1